MTAPASIAVPGGRLLIPPRSLTVGGVLLGVTALLVVLGLSRGDFPLPLPHVVTALAGTGDPAAVVVVRELRLPRVLLGVLVGLAFGAAGALLQSLARNPLASPDVVGITEGANTAAVAAIVAGAGGAGAWGVLGTGGSALVGGLLTAAVVVALTGRSGVSGSRIVLMGIGVGAACAALTDYLLVRADTFRAQEAMVWLAGSLSGRGWSDVALIAAVLVVGLPVAAALGVPMRALALGEDVAAGLGVRVTRVRLAAVVTSVALTAAATAAAGPVAFVALAAPQIACRLTRRPTPPALGAALTGAVLVLAADLAGRLLVPGVELPVGIVTGVLGAPYLLWLVVRAHRAGTGG